MGAVRLFLALAVLQSHVNSQYLRPAQIYVNNVLVLGVNGGYAVMFFFIISGFLISFVLEEKYDWAGGTYAFYKARVLRIYPLWWIAFIAAVLLLAPDSWRSVLHMPLHVLLSGFFIWGSDLLLSFKTYPMPYEQVFPDGLGLGWSLASEMTFYLVAPFILRSTRASIFVLALSVLARMVLNLRYPLEQVGVNTWVLWCYYFFPSTAMFFVLGHLSRLFYRNVKLPSWIGGAGIAAAGFVCWLQDAHYNFENVDFYVAVLFFTVALPAMFKATKDSRIMNFLGDLTYPLYLSHGILLGLVNRTPWATDAVQQLIGFAKSVSGHVLVEGAIISAVFASIALTFAVLVRFAVEIPAVAMCRAALARVEAAFGAARIRKPGRFPV